MDPQIDTQNLEAETIASEEIVNQAKVSEFKTALADIRLRRAGVIQEMLKLKGIIKVRNEESGNLKFMFRKEAITMYPELAARDITSVLKEISPVHPLSSLWANYMAKIDGQTLQLNKAVNNYNSLADTDNVYAKSEKENLVNYAKFYEMSSTPVMPPEQMESELQLLSQIPYAEEGSTIVTLPAIEHLNPEAAAMIMMQALASETNGELSKIDQAYEGDEYYNGELQPSYEQVKYLSATGSSESSGLDVKGLKPWGLLLGVVGLWYVLSGDKK